MQYTVHPVHSSLQASSLWNDTEAGKSTDLRFNLRLRLICLLHVKTFGFLTYQQKQILFTLLNPDICSSPVKSLLLYLRTACLADFSHPVRSFRHHSHLNKHFKALCSRESPCQQIPSDVQKACTVLSLPRYISKSPPKNKYLSVPVTEPWRLDLLFYFCLYKGDISFGNAPFLYLWTCLQHLALEWFPLISHLDFCFP